MTGCRTECHSLAHNEPAVQEVKVYLHHCQQPLQFYRELRAQGVRAVRFIPQLKMPMHGEISFAPFSTSGRGKILAA